MAYFKVEVQIHGRNSDEDIKDIIRKMKSILIDELHAGHYTDIEIELQESSGFDNPPKEFIV